MRRAFCGCFGATRLDDQDDLHFSVRAEPGIHIEHQVRGPEMTGCRPSRRRVCTQVGTSSSPRDGLPNGAQQGVEGRRGGVDSSAADEVIMRVPMDVQQLVSSSSEHGRGRDQAGERAMHEGSLPAEESSPVISGAGADRGRGGGAGVPTVGSSSPASAHSSPHTSSRTSKTSSSRMNPSRQGSLGVMLVRLYCTLTPPLTPPLTPCHEPPLTLCREPPLAMPAKLYLMP